jgi:hypothetical protein
MSEQDSLFDPPTRKSDLEEDLRKLSRRSDPGTSHAAARSLPNRQTLMALLLRAYRDRGLTDEEAARVAGVDRESGHKRCSDLRNAGLIEPLMWNGKVVTRAGSSGRQQRVCVLTADGRAAL